VGGAGPQAIAQIANLRHNRAMHITLIALGSRGDVQPYATLGQGLQAAGHRVRFATFESFAPLIQSPGLELHPIHGDAQTLVGGAGADMLKLVRSFGGLARGYAADLTPIASLKTDLIINQLPGALYGYDLAERLGVPLIMAGVIPLAASRAYPNLAFPPLPSSGYNLLTHRMAEQMLWAMFRSVINEWRRKSLGLPPSPFFGYFRELDRKRVPVLNGFSKHIVPRPPDWGDHIHLTGYWFPRDEAWRPPVELQSFIDSGSPPVFVGFGSMPVRHPALTTRLILNAIQQTDQRAILHAGWGGLGGESLPSNVFHIDYAPYDWLFPRMAAIVHHGGSGTTNFGLRAGVPSMIVPFVFDQFYWGNRLETLGVGPGPIPIVRLTADRLARAITQMVTDSAMRARAAEMGKKIRSEDGLARAVEIVEHAL
jgi:UDP:flavonoid glycosyltransferase YjiC (YdhE family)